MGIFWAFWWELKREPQKDFSFTSTDWEAWVAGWVHYQTSLSSFIQNSINGLTHRTLFPWLATLCISITTIHMVFSHFAWDWDALFPPKQQIKISLALIHISQLPGPIFGEKKNQVGRGTWHTVPWLNCSVTLLVSKAPLNHKVKKGCFWVDRTFGLTVQNSGGHLFCFFVFRGA